MNQITFNIEPRHMRAYNISKELIDKIADLQTDLQFKSGLRLPNQQVSLVSVMLWYHTAQLSLEEVACLIPLCNQAPWVWEPVVTSIQAGVFHNRGWLLRAPEKVGLTHLGRELMHDRPDVGLRNIILHHLDGTDSTREKVANILRGFCAGSFNGA